MDMKISKLAKVIKGWSDLLGTPVLIIALLIAGLLVIAHEFFGEPIPLDAAIRKDLEKPEQFAPEPTAKAAQSSHGER